MKAEDVIKLLPPRIAERFSGFKLDDVCEIHMVSDRPMTLTVSDRTVPFGTSVSPDELEEVVRSLCGGSLHSYEGTIACGYIPLGDGTRAGVCGIRGGDSLLRVTSVRIRIPRTVYGIGESLVRHLMNVQSGMLIYSPPGVGKTTLLRDVSSILSSPPYFKRVSIIDSRDEIYRADAFSRSCADVYTLYPKAEAIEQAVRTMSPQYIVCDELGQSEAEAILSTMCFGVPVIATVHAPSLEALAERDVFRELDRKGAFSLYVGLTRQGVGFVYRVDTSLKRREGALC